MAHHLTHLTMRLALRVSALTAALLAPALASAQSWTNWTSGQCPSAGTPFVSGSLGFANVTVTGPIYGYQLGGSANNPCGTLSTNSGQPTLSYFQGYTAYNGAATPNQYGLVQLDGNGTFTITFSTPVLNPYLALVSVGGGTPVTYNFDRPYTILSSNAAGGTAHWGGGSVDTSVPGRLTGSEFSGTIRLDGTFSSLTIVTQPDEQWHAFTVGAAGLATNTVPEPSTYALMAAGLAAIGALARRRRRA